MIFSSVYGKNDEGKALEILTQIINYSNWVKSEDEKKYDRHPIIFFFAH